MSSNAVDLNKALRCPQAPFTGAGLAAPFVKWAGGKRSLIAEIAKRFPASVDKYWEPFVGGGAVFFAFATRIKHAVLSDTNEELVCTYRVVKGSVNKLVTALRRHERLHEQRAGKKYVDGKTYYRRVREASPTDPVEIAARFIYLNKTCYNGLYRVNRRGRFNVPEGDYRQPDICNVERLRKCSAALSKADIRLGDFEQVMKPTAGDFIYCDPPYDGCFTGYQAAGFSAAEQERLHDAAKRWRQAGARVLLSNADTKEMRTLYTGWNVRAAHAPRNINCKSGGRGAAAELIITND